MGVFSASGEGVLDRSKQIHYNPRSAGPLAQWLEQATHNRLVAGSNPAGATKFINNLQPKDDFQVFPGIPQGYFSMQQLAF